MRRPPNDFRERFRRAFEQTFHGNPGSYHLFRREFDFDGFFEIIAPQCENERHIAFAFLCRFLPHLTDDLAETICVAVMLFLSQSLGRREPDGGDIQAAKALRQMPVIDEKQLTNWINSYYVFPP